LENIRGNHTAMGFLKLFCLFNLTKLGIRTPQVILKNYLISFTLFF